MKQWCNTCCAEVEGAQFCVYGMCPFHPERKETEVKEMEMPLRIKDVKCTKCKERVPFTPEAMDLAASTCKYRLRTDFMACGMKQWGEFMNKEHKKQVPALLQQPIVVQPTMLSSSTAVAVVEPESEFFELDMPPVIRIQINKKGHVTNTSEQ
jgi:hypothetical protein